jgi:hypothetical protein
VIDYASLPFGAPLDYSDNEWVSVRRALWCGIDDDGAARIVVQGDPLEPVNAAAFRFIWGPPERWARAIRPVEDRFTATEIQLRDEIEAIKEENTSLGSINQALRMENQALRTKQVSTIGDLTSAGLEVHSRTYMRSLEAKAAQVDALQAALRDRPFVTDQAADHIASVRTRIDERWTEYHTRETKEAVLDVIDALLVGTHREPKPEASSDPSL